MLYTIGLVIAWTCVGVFIASSIITILALVRVIRLPNQKYLNRLFTIIIVAIVGTCASFFQQFLSRDVVITDKEPATNAVVPPNKELGSNKVGPGLRTNEVVTRVTNPVPERGWIGFKHSGAYVAKFYLNWKEDGQPKSWSSGNKTDGFSEVIWMQRNAREIKITAQAATGLFWDPWGTIFKLEFPNGPPNKVYVAKGTSLNRSWATADR